MLRAGLDVLHLSPFYPITAFGVLGIVFLLVSLKPNLISSRLMILLRILSGIAGFIVIFFILIKGDIALAFTNGIFTVASLPGFPFAGGLLIHIIFEHALGGSLGLILAIKPSLLIRSASKVRR
ncbi:hypothetical protein [Acidianus manzaensis]|uniref:Uncharacterized protein n=1 Tax=Acidianus manzaensis TaxID=282676 RepID=A0A1W6JYE1_9CREN|nr:hypothetical protein [Acidianus manzaensis]ARM75283.1 hypothetical protein B6F84_04050 [Acidianus manzaensis]